MKVRCLAALALLAALSPLRAEETAAQRGKKNLETKVYNAPTIALSAYDNAWKHWGVKEKPKKEEYDKLFRERYGLHPAPYPNDDLPMGLKKGEMFLTKQPGLAVDCLICHGGSIFGKSYVGLGNTALDYHLFHEELNAMLGKAKPPFTFTRVRGTSEAGGMAVFLLGHREPDLTLRFDRKDLDLKDDLVEDAPAWWQLKKKKRMYHTGGSDQRSVRSIMQFMMSPVNGPKAFEKAEADFKDVREYLLSIEAPAYPLEIDRKLAAKGAEVFGDNCARCHGTYGEKWTYPGKIVPLKEIGTDPKRYEGITKKFGDYYDKSWFGGDYKSMPSDGYQAPPLDGVWATAPYFHNGCAPTLYHVLNSKARPKLFTRSYRTDKEDYDEKRVGWKYQELKEAPDPKKTPAHELRKVYDTSLPGRSNGGHTYGDKLSEDERAAVIEYLKTL